MARGMSEQVQKLKLDTEAAMLELDQILRANELTVAVVAAIPSLAIAGGTGYLLIRWITPSPPDRKSEALPARLLTWPWRCLLRQLAVCHGLLPKA